MALYLLGGGLLEIAFPDLKVPDLLVGGQFLVSLHNLLLDQLVQLLRNRNLSEFFNDDLHVWNDLGADNCILAVFIIHALYYGFFYIFAFVEIEFHVLGEYILTVLGYNNILFAPYYVQESFLVNIAVVASIKPAFTQNRRRRLRVLIVAQHGNGASDLDFTYAVGIGLV